MIRKYGDHDLDDLLEVWHQASVIAHHFMDDEFFAGERKAIQNDHLPIADTWVYESEGKVVGFISLLGENVGAIFVHPAMQSKGIGRSLMDHARSLRGQLQLEVFKANRAARAFYDQYGFEVVEEYFHEALGHPMLKMQLDFEGIASDPDHKSAQI